MKVLIFSLAYIPFIGGAELAVKEITDRIGSPRFDNRVEADLSNDITPELILHLDLLKDRLSVKSFLTYY